MDVPEENQSVEPFPTPAPAAAKRPAVREIADVRPLLEETPPDVICILRNWGRTLTGPTVVEQTLRASVGFDSIQLDCSCCGGPRWFAAIRMPESGIPLPGAVIVTYRCRNCSKEARTFAIACEAEDEGDGLRIWKLGESPAYGRKLPSKVISLIREDRELFNQGWRSESRGFGIGAYAYYRRVVENQKNRIFDQIIKVAERLGGRGDLITQLQKAKEQRQFAEAIGQIHAGLPESLLLNGQHSPLQLLHNALSKGLHGRSDDECLEDAHAIRLVLTDLAERVETALRDQKELNDAVAKLMNQ